MFQIKHYTFCRTLKVLNEIIRNIFYGTLIIVNRYNQISANIIKNFFTIIVKNKNSIYFISILKVNNL